MPPDQIIDYAAMGSLVLLVGCGAVMAISMTLHIVVETWRPRS